jgi:hypothetical protein
MTGELIIAGPDDAAHPDAANAIVRLSATRIFLNSAAIVAESSIRAAEIAEMRTISNS